MQTANSIYLGEKLFHRINESLTVHYHHRCSQWVVHMKGESLCEYTSFDEFDALEFAFNLANKGECNENSNS